MRQNLRYIIPILIPLIILLLPASAFPIDGLTVIQQRVIAIFFIGGVMLGNGTYSYLRNLSCYHCAGIIIIVR